MVSNPGVGPMMRFFTASTFIQSVLWFVLGLLGLLTNNGAIHFPSSDTKSHDVLIANTLKSLYFSKEKTDLIVDDNTLLIFMVLYMVMSSLWIALSGLLFYLSNVSHLRGYQINALCYAIITTIVTSLDLILMSMLIDDYTKVYQLSLKSNVIVIAQDVTYVLIVIGAMMTLAARGYVLILLNVTNIVYSLFVYVSGIRKRRYQEQNLFNIPIDAYKEYPGHKNYVEAVNEEPFSHHWPRAEHNAGFISDGWDNHNLAPATSPVVQPVTRIQEFANPQERFASSQVTPPVPVATEVPLWLGSHHSQTNIDREHDRVQTPEGPRKVEQTPYALPVKIPKPPPPMPPPKPAKKYVKPQKPQGKKGPPIPFPDYSPPESPKDLRSVIKPHSSYY